jgi:hypothetical protein
LAEAEKMIADQYAKEREEQAKFDAETREWLALLEM